MVRVLVVDDDPTILHLLQINLEMEGHEVLLAADGHEALARLRADRPQVVLLDVMMPRLDGWQVCAQIRADPELADTPVVFLSARAQESDRDRGDEVGADAYVTKPFDPLELVELVERLAAEGR